MYQWGGTQPGETQTPAALQAGFHLNEYSIAPLVAAIIQHKARMAALQSQQIEAAGKSIGGAIGQYEQGRDAGQLADFQQQGLTDQSDAVMNPQQQDDFARMSPRAKAAAMGWLSNQQHLSAQQDLQQQGIDSRNDLALQRLEMQGQLNDSRMNAAEALANQRWLNPYGMGGDADPSVAKRREQITNQAIIAQDLAGSGLKPEQVNFDQPGAVKYVDAKGNPVSEEIGKASPGAYSAEFTNPKDQSTSQIPLSNYLAARDLHRQSTGLSPAIQPQAQMPVNPSAQTIPVGTQRPDPATGGTIVWDGRGWVRQ